MDAIEEWQEEQQQQQRSLDTPVHIGLCGLINVIRGNLSSRTADWRVVPPLPLLYGKSIWAIVMCSQTRALAICCDVFCHGWPALIQEQT